MKAAGLGVACTRHKVQACPARRIRLESRHMANALCMYAKVSLPSNLPLFLTKTSIYSTSSSLQDQQGLTDF